VRILSDDAILLEVADLSDGDRLVAFFSRRHGNLRGAARGARRRYSRFAGQLQPLARVHVTWLEKEERDLVRVRGVELVRPAHRLWDDLEGTLVACYLAEHVKVFAPEREADETLFRLLDTTLEALLAGVDRQLAARYFESWVLRLAGIFPPPRECPACGRDLGEGAALPRGGEGLLCRECAGGGAFGVPPDLVAFLRRIGRESLPQVAADPPAEDVVGRLESLTAEVRRAFLHHELKSYEVMRRTLG
jgi:DNA repair protein RecO (recombination protein O)